MDKKASCFYPKVANRPIICLIKGRKRNLLSLENKLRSVYVLGKRFKKGFKI